MLITPNRTISELGTVFGDAVVAQLAFTLPLEY